MRYYLIVSALLLSMVASSQTYKKNTVKIQPYAYGQFGIVAGEAKTKEQVQLVTGIRKGAWYAGVGAAVDNYHTRSVPVFIDIRRDIFTKRNAPFAYANMGYTCLWLKESETILWEKDRKGGLYYDIGLGYKAALTEKFNLIFSAGFSRKSFTRTIDTEPWSSRWPPSPSAIRNYEYTLNRIVFKAGLGF